MNEFSKRHPPLGDAPNWQEHTWANRVNNSIVCLILFGALTEEEGRVCFDRMNEWFNSNKDINSVCK